MKIIIIRDEKLEECLKINHLQNLKLPSLNLKIQVQKVQVKAQKIQKVLVQKVQLKMDHCQKDLQMMWVTKRKN